ncbi:MAG: glycine oxidase ThiO, partial [Planctomycetes bacterium]|nr:glycine oxidase ThiO [Planctomycetota bacterium]
MHDCLIVGAGVIGMSLARELAGHGLSVHVIDRAAVGKEASWAGAGILPPANPATSIHSLQKLRALSHVLHPRWAATLREETGIDTGYRKCGGICLARSAGEAASLRALKGLYDEEDIAFEQLNSEELLELEPVFRPLVHAGKITAAFQIPDESQLRNPDHLRALLASCNARGVKVTADVAAKSFEVTAGRMVAVHTDSKPIFAESVCIASGAWTHAILQQLRVPNGIMPVRGQMVMYRCDKQPFSRIINEGPRYLVPRDDGRVLVGSTEEEVGFDKSTTEDGLDELMTLAESLIPELVRERVERTWAGLRPGSFDGFPYLGKIPGLDNAFVAAGHFRSGLQMSPATAIVMSQLIRGET